jgi:hypothetical protein
MRVWDHFGGDAVTGITSSRDALSSEAYVRHPAVISAASRHMIQTTSMNANAHLLIVAW